MVLDRHLDAVVVLVANQEQASAVTIADADWLRVDGFWTEQDCRGLKVLTHEAIESDRLALLVFTSIRALTGLGRPDATLFEGECGTVLFSSPNVVDCVPMP